MEERTEYKETCDLREIHAAVMSQGLESVLKRKGEYIENKRSPVDIIIDYGTYKQCKVRGIRSLLSGLEGKARIEVAGRQADVKEVVAELKHYFQKMPSYAIMWLYP
jgi:hypothetical protein